jgi:N-acetylmuramoyl-L-alanine amidase
MKPLMILLDAGHGGIIGGKYVTAPSKQFHHQDGSWAYEGVINRQIKNILVVLLEQEGITYRDIAPDETDTKLEVRTAYANRIMAQLGNEYNFLYVSIHSNAGGGSGFEVWTSPGQTLSDRYAEIWVQELKKEFPEFPFRADKTDGDLDKESKFWVLVHTAMPAVLGELLFFDNFNDWKVQRTLDYTVRISNCMLSFIKRAQTEVVQ